MAIPDFQSIMLPLLRLASDGELHKLSDATEQLADQFGLSEVERRERLKSGTLTFNNRVGWAKTYLKNSGLLSLPKRAHLQITARGQELLEDPPDRIDIPFLKEHYPEIKEFREGKESDEEPKKEVREAGDVESTPQELIERGYSEMQESLSSELLDKVKSASPIFFEQLVVDLLLKMGYGGSRKDAGESVGRSGDGGIDGIIKEDKLGLDVIYVQAKRWEGNVGRPVVQAFAGSLEGVRAHRGILITTSDFSKEARQYVKAIEKRIILIDGETLTQYMSDYNLGISTTATYEVKRIDNDYFEEA